jgi:hypothetical protein
LSFLTGWTPAAIIYTMFATYQWSGYSAIGARWQSS